MLSMHTYPRSRLSIRVALVSAHFSINQASIVPGELLYSKLMTCALRERVESLGAAMTKRWLSTRWCGRFGSAVPRMRLPRSQALHHQSLVLVENRATIVV